MERLLNPRLVGIGGPVEGGLFALADDELSVGRDPVNQLIIPDPSVSRRHCSIRKLAPDRFEIRDLSSRNGTVVNGIPITERLLRDHDEIRIGECQFLFLLHESQDSLTAVPIHYDADMDSATYHRLRREDSRLSLERPDTRARLSGSLAMLIQIGAVIHTARGVEEIARKLLERIFDAIPAERGAILLYDGAGGEPSFVCSRARQGETTAAVRAHGDVIAQARQEGNAILASGAPGEESRRVLVAPIVSQDKTLGVIYLEAGDPRVEFDRQHLELAAAAGGIVGMPIENAQRLEWLEAENRRLREAADIPDGMVGTSAPIREVFQFVAKVAPSDSTVLIRGESGTGKELVARSIHRNSRRASQAFVAINCAALTETLLESELFGHEKGAFTGAIARKKGKIEVADRGTLFLDEAGELPLAFQTKLLRVLQEREFERVGGTQTIQVDVRLIAATNRDLDAAIAAGTFRRDLYYRLNVVSINLPPLRERREDIAALARHFAAKHGKRSTRRLAGLSSEAIACLEAYDWPGNVRELENAIEHAVVLGSTELILPDDLPEAVLEAAPAGPEAAGGYHDEVRAGKRRAILAALEKSGGNYTEAAKLLGLHPNYLHRLVRNLNLRAEIKKGNQPA